MDKKPLVRFAGMFFVILTWMFLIVIIVPFVFVIYPNYIYAGKYGSIYKAGEKFGQKVLNLFPQLKVEEQDEDLMQGFIETKDEVKPVKELPKVFQPLFQRWMVKDLPVKAFYNKPTSGYMLHPTMIPTSFVEYAPMPGKLGSAEHNFQQFRYSENLKINKASNEIRIFIVGGSTAWGSFAPDNKSTISGFLEKKLNAHYPSGLDIKVINAAVGGWTTTQERIWIFNRITEYQPGIIISYSGRNDVENVA